jgi:membrane-bound serine protease (ClpP class)
METVVVLILAGIALLALETVLPGLVAGLAGFACLVAAVVAAYARLGPETGNWVLFALTGGLVVAAVLWVRYFPNSRLGSLFVTRGTVGDLNVGKPELVGQTGTALSNLRPSGIALIGGKRVDVVTEGGMVERGASVKVLAVEGLRVVVRPCAVEAPAEKA